MFDGTVPMDYVFHMRVTTLGGGVSWFGPYTIRVKCPDVVIMIGLKTTSLSGLITQFAAY